VRIAGAPPKNASARSSRLSLNTWHATTSSSLRPSAHKRLSPSLGGVYTAWHAHVRVLLRELDPDLDDDMTAYLLLACLRPGPSRRFATQRELGRLLEAIDVLLRHIPNEPA